MKGSILMLVTLISSTVLGRPILSSPAVKKLDSYLQAVNYAEPDEEFDELHDAGQNTWELSGKFEGDIILSDQQLIDVSKRWPGKTLVYTIDKRNFSGEQIDAILEGMADLQRSSCIKFKEKTPDDKAYVLIQGGPRGCYSNLGYLGKAQVLNLTPDRVGKRCLSHGTIIHEMLHSLGFSHMHSSTKRDDFVKIKWNNIERGRKKHFKKYDSHKTSDFGVPYDYDSVLHYNSFAFSKNGRKTIVPLNGDSVTIGQRVGLSEKDITKLNRMYQCDGGDEGSSGGSGDGGDEGSSWGSGDGGSGDGGSGDGGSGDGGSGDGGSGDGGSGDGGSGGYGGLETFSEDEDDNSAEGFFFSDDEDF